MKNNTRTKEKFKLSSQPDGVGYYYGQYEGFDNELYRIDVKVPGASTKYKLYIDGEYQEGFDCDLLVDVYDIIDEAISLWGPKR